MKLNLKAFVEALRLAGWPARKEEKRSGQRRAEGTINLEDREGRTRILQFFVLFHLFLRFSYNRSPIISFIIP